MRLRMANTTNGPSTAFESPFLDSTVLEGVRRESEATPWPATEHEKVTTGPQILVVGAHGAPVVDGEYAIHQDGVSEGGKLPANGRILLGKIDPKRPFMFEVRDRVCAI